MDDRQSCGCSPAIEGIITQCPPNTRGFPRHVNGKRRSSGWQPDNWIRGRLVSRAAKPGTRPSPAFGRQARAGGPGPGGAPGSPPQAGGGLCWGLHAGTGITGMLPLPVPVPVRSRARALPGARPGGRLPAESNLKSPCQ